MLKCDAQEVTGDAHFSRINPPLFASRADSLHLVSSTRSPSPTTWKMEDARHQSLEIQCTGITAWRVQASVSLRRRMSKKALVSCFRLYKAVVRPSGYMSKATSNFNFQRNAGTTISQHADLQLCLSSRLAEHKQSNLQIGGAEWQIFPSGWPLLLCGSFLARDFTRMCQARRQQGSAFGCLSRTAAHQSSRDPDRVWSAESSSKSTLRKKLRRLWSRNHDRA